MDWNFWKKKHSQNAVPDPLCKGTPLQVKAVTESLPSRRLINPCLTCGACCAFFRVSFPNDELDRFTGGRVPTELAGTGSTSLSFMRGTETKKPRCIALEGFIGSHVKCTIYSNRPSTCMAFCRSWENNVGNLLCDRARAAYGLQTFSQY